MRDLTDVDEAVASLTDALDEEYPGEWLDPTALQVVLSELARLRAVERRAWDVADAGGFREDWETHVLRDPRPGPPPGGAGAPEEPSSQVSA